MSSELKKHWTTKAGLQATIWFVHNSHHCGYVGIPKGHPLYGKQYGEKTGRELPEETPVGKQGAISIFCYALDSDKDSGYPIDLYFNVHGGITYSRIGGDEYPLPGDTKLWWFGFDCSHLGDKTLYHEDGEFRTVEYCVDECESLAQQFVEFAPINSDNQVDSDPAPVFDSSERKEPA